MRWFDLILGCFCVVLLIVGIVTFLQVDGLRTENAALSSEVEELKVELEDARSTIVAQGRKVNEVELEMGGLEEEVAVELGALSMQIEDTQGRLGALEENFTLFEEAYVELQGSYDAKVEEYTQLTGQLEDFEDSLEEKMYWYSENADFNGENRNFLNTIDGKCVNGNTLNMPCVAMMLDQKGFEYISEGTDYIKSLDEFEAGDGGDCEDWSMFVKAIITEMEREEGINELEVVHFGKPGRTDIYEDGNTLYYYPYGSVTMKVEELSVGCFPMPYGKGHCAIISEDVLFEPQDGSYLSGVGWEGNDLLINTGGEIEILIDNRDIHVKDDDEWISYGHFIERIHSVLEEVRNEVEEE